MKKLFLTMLLLMVLTFGAAQTCLAADVPVYLEGERVATGLGRGGYTYLPLRTMFETVGAEVEWSEPEQKIIATFAEGGVLTMQVGEMMAQTTFPVQFAGQTYLTSNNYCLETAAFVESGVTYVPLRFVTEAALNYEVEWQDGSVRLKHRSSTCADAENQYAFDVANGNFSVNGQILANGITLPAQGACNPVSHSYKLKVTKTAAGNYLLTDYYSLHLTLDESYTLRWYAWVSADGRKSFADYACALNDMHLPQAVQQDGRIIFSGQHGIWQIDEAAGEAEYLSQPEQLAANSLWTDGRYYLLKCFSQYVVFDTQTTTYTNLSYKVINPVEYKLQIDWSNGLSYDDLARYLTIAENNTSNLPYLEFTGEENHMLHFNLHTGNAQVLPLNYSLPE